MKSDPWDMSESHVYHIQAWLIKAFSMTLHMCLSLLICHPKTEDSVEASKALGTVRHTIGGAWVPERLCGAEHSPFPSILFDFEGVKNKILFY